MRHTQTHTHIQIAPETMRHDIRRQARFLALSLLEPFRHTHMCMFVLPATYVACHTIKNVSDFCTVACLQNVASLSHVAKAQPNLLVMVCAKPSLTYPPTHCTTFHVPPSALYSPTSGSACRSLGALFSLNWGLTGVDDAAYGVATVPVARPTVPLVPRCMRALAAVLNFWALFGKQRCLWPP